MTYRVGVDIGGSFTDFAVFDEQSQAITSLKVFSRPDEPGAEVLEGVRLLEERHGIAPAAISYFTHGTTVGINTVIQRKGLKLALFTTAGFRDVLELARLKIPDMYSLLSKRPAPLIARDMVWGIPGRLGADGAEETPLDEAAVEQAARGRGRGRGRGSGDRLPARLPQRRARARGEGGGAARRAWSAGVLLARDLADHPRIRAHHHRGDRRLRAAAGRELPDPTAGGAAACRRADAAAHHQVEWRGDDGRAGQAGLRADDPVRHRLGGDRRELMWPKSPGCRAA